jgi:predicted DNA-binding antitoxin AbrB/MazE fold protein
VKVVIDIGVMRPVEATYENGLLKPEHPLQLRPGERVGVILVRRPDPSRWDLERIAAAVGSEDDELAALGVDDWSAELEREDTK